MLMTAPLRGSYYNPPAKAILECLPTRTPLILEREPENPYDPNAVQVLVATSNLKEVFHQKLETLANAQGFELATILAEPQWWLGFVGREFAAALSPILEADPTTYTATLTFDIKGAPLVDIFIPD